MSVSSWEVVPRGDTWMVVFPNLDATVGGFLSAEDAHGWLLEYMIEWGRMHAQQDSFARERREEQEMRRQNLAANILMGLEHITDKRH